MPTSTRSVKGKTIRIRWENAGDARISPYLKSLPGGLRDRVKRTRPGSLLPGDRQPLKQQTKGEEMRIPRAPLGCVLLVIFTVLLQFTSAAAANPSPQAKKPVRAARKVPQINLKSIELLKEAFERDSGKLRLVTILSPT